MKNDKRSFIGFLVVFLMLFLLLNYGTFFFIGLTVPGGYYSFFFDHYLDYPEGLHKSLLLGAGALLRLFGIETHVFHYDRLFIVGGQGIQLAYDCLGYGVLSFWAAYVLANKGTFLSKSVWLLGGWLILWFINVCRISIFLVAVNKKWEMPLNIGQHTWFNIISYIFIFILILIFEKKLDKRSGDVSGLEFRKQM